MLKVWYQKYLELVEFILLVEDCRTELSRTPPPVLVF